ncbi:MAG: ImmA/IrrE family metallo-endopeptidase [bacterium]
MITFRNPGKEYLSKYSFPTSPTDLAGYTVFLRHESGVGDGPPVDLQHICHHFGMPTPKLAPLEDQQGVLVCPDRGIVIIKENDPHTRQRFTLAHELAEFLFDHQNNLAGGISLGDWWRSDKEKYCDQCAADLLMPDTTFLPRLAQLGISMDAASHLAKEYDTSFSATMLKMVRCAQGSHLMIVWKKDISPIQTKLANAGQTALFGDDPTLLPQADLMVWWYEASPGLIPFSGCYSRTPATESIIRQIFEEGGTQVAREALVLNRRSIDCVIEAKKVKLGTCTCVISLLHLPDDNCNSTQSCNLL